MTQLLCLSVKNNISTYFPPIQFSTYQKLFIAKNKSSLEMLIRTRLGSFKEVDLMGALNQLTGDRSIYLIFPSSVQKIRIRLLADY